MHAMQRWERVPLERSNRSCPNWCSWKRILACTGLLALLLAVVGGFATHRTWKACAVDQSVSLDQSDAPLHDALGVDQHTCGQLGLDRFVDDDGVLVMSVGNLGGSWLDLAVNFVCSANEVGIRPVLLSSGRGQCARFRRATGFGLHGATNSSYLCHDLIPGSAATTYYGTDLYQDLMRNRTMVWSYVHRCIATTPAYNERIQYTLFVDSDAVFTRDPRPELLTRISGEVGGGASKSIDGVSGSGALDALFTSDRTGLKVVDSLLPARYLCGGFVMLRVSPKTRRVLAALWSFQQTMSWNDQVGWNVCARVWTRQGLDFRWAVLPRQLVQNGPNPSTHGEHQLFSPKAWAAVTRMHPDLETRAGLFRSSTAVPAVFHANWLLGVKHKIPFLMNHGLWCDRHRLSAVCMSFMMFAKDHVPIHCRVQPDDQEPSHRIADPPHA